MSKSMSAASSVWLSKESCSIGDFKNLVEITTGASAYPLAASIESNVPIYDAAHIRQSLADKQLLRRYLAEWNAVFLDGPGIVMFRNTYEDKALIDGVSQVLRDIIESEKQRKPKGGDHFAKAGANARVWNAHEKLAIAAPELFIRYNANEILSLVSQSWLGPNYQITAQVNLVYPGGAAQTPHRDYHMGFQTQEQLVHYPAYVHQLSAALTLQGAIAHCDMPVESGPTKLLPYSQRYLPGYFAVQLPEFRDYFEEHYVQLPLQKGDTLFFNPALFHAAGTNQTKDVERLANLLQIGSGYGRSIEIVGRARLSKAIYAKLCEFARTKTMSVREIDNVIAAAAEGYPFPADLDIDSPLSGMAPPSQQDIMRKAVAENWDLQRFFNEIDAYEHRRSESRDRI